MFGLSAINIKLLSIQSAYYWFLDKYEGTYTKRILGESLDLLRQLWPYLVVGVVLTTLVKLFVSKQWLAKTFGATRGNLSIIIASLLGVLSPLGSYVVIPLSAALFTAGVPLPVLMALMVSSPLINPNLFFLTTGAMGLEMAAMRLASAFTLGVVAGYATQYMVKKKYIDLDKVLSAGGHQTMGDVEAGAAAITFQLFFYELYRMARYVSKYFFLAIFIAAGIKILANPNVVIKVFEGNTFLSVLISTGAGVPFYVCGGAAIPVVQQLAELGMSQGAVPGFFYFWASHKSVKPGDDAGGFPKQNPGSLPGSWHWGCFHYWDPL